MPGSDPALRDQYVVFSAHMDHVGIGAPDATGDSIYNGADDDASGTVAVVEVAEAVAALTTRPARSMIFLLVSGEERGLWGSAHFAKFPPVPLERLIANLNADMVGRNWSDTIVAVGSEHSDLGETLATVNALHPELGMTVVDDPCRTNASTFAQTITTSLAGVCRRSSSSAGSTRTTTGRATRSKTSTPKRRLALRASSSTLAWRLRIHPTGPRGTLEATEK